MHFQLFSSSLFLSLIIPHRYPASSRTVFADSGYCVRTASLRHVRAMCSTVLDLTHLEYSSEKNGILKVIINLPELIISEAYKMQKKFNNTLQ